jgi:hypothetical protein
MPAALAQHRGQLGEHHRQILLLAEEAVGARLQHLHLGGVVVRRGHQQAGGVAQRRVEADPADHRGTVDAGHHPVHDHRLGAAVGGHPQPGLAGRRGQHRVPLGFEQLDQPLPEGEAVVDDQHGDAVVAALRFAQQLAGAGHHVPGVVGLVHVLVRAEPQAGQPVGDVAPAGQHHRDGVLQARVRVQLAE